MAQLGDEFYFILYNHEIYNRGRTRFYCLRQRSVGPENQYLLFIQFNTVKPQPRRRRCVRPPMEKESKHFMKAILPSPIHATQILSSLYSYETKRCCFTPLFAMFSESGLDAF
ncbi:hypothetical protein P8452_18923 [Trifolium repens]|nr:hypothetical protein P8452_18923 [Trifolium repens]